MADITEIAAALSAQLLTARAVEDPDEPGRQTLVLGDDEVAIEITHDIGNLGVAGEKLLAAANIMAGHARFLLYQHHRRTGGWT